MRITESVSHAEINERLGNPAAIYPTYRLNGGNLVLDITGQVIFAWLSYYAPCTVKQLGSIQDSSPEFDSAQTAVLPLAFDRVPLDQPQTRSTRPEEASMNRYISLGGTW